MKGAVLSFAFAQVIVGAVLERQAAQGCDMNNCLIAVGGLASQPDEIVSARSACLSHLDTTTTLLCRSVTYHWLYIYPLANPFYIALCQQRRQLLMFLPQRRYSPD